jgi:hypothetical protein
VANPRFGYIYPFETKQVIALFRERNSLQVPALIAATLLLKMSFVSQPWPEGGYPNPGGLLPLLLNDYIVPGVRTPWLLVVGQLVMLGSAIYGNLVVSNRRMFAQNHLLVAFCMVLLSTLFAGTNHSLTGILLLPFVIGFFSNITQLYQQLKPQKIVVNAGLLAGTCALLYHPFFFVLPVAFIGLSIMRPFRAAEWVLMLVALLCPFYFVFSIDFLLDRWQPQRHLPSFAGLSRAWNPALFWSLALSTFGVWFALAFFRWIRLTRRMVIQGRKNWYVLLFLLLFMLPGVWVPDGNAFSMLTLATFPASAFLANAFAGEQKSVGQILFFWLLMAAIIVSAWVWLHYT